MALARLNHEVIRCEEQSSAGAAPLYQFLTKTAGGEIQWNFTKFLVDRNGKVIQRFESPVTPDSPEVISAIESALKK